MALQLNFIKKWKKNEDNNLYHLYRSLETSMKFPTNLFCSLSFYQAPIHRPLKCMRGLCPHHSKVQLAPFESPRLYHTQLKKRF